jgi:hypothetical protein
MEDALTTAAEAFFEIGGGNLQLVPPKREVKLSRILDWYRADFARTDEVHRGPGVATGRGRPAHRVLPAQDLVRWIATFVNSEETASMLRSWAQEGNFKLSFIKYDWSINKQQE